MFLKVTEFHWHGLIGPALAIIGAAVVLAALSIFFYYKQSRRLEGAGEKGIEIMKLKRMGISGILMMGAGLAAFPVLGGGQTLSERYEFVMPGEKEVAKIFYYPLKADRPMTAIDLILKAAMTTAGDELSIVSNGYIETPFVVFGEGEYSLEFLASGVEISRETSRILVGLLELTPEGTKLIGNPIFFDLTPAAKVFRIPLRVRPGMIGAVRIEFINVPTKKPEEIRSIKISKMEFKRETR